MPTTRGCWPGSRRGTAWLPGLRDAAAAAAGSTAMTGDAHAFEYAVLRVVPEGGPRRGDQRRHRAVLPPAAVTCGARWTWTPTGCWRWTRPPTCRGGRSGRWPPIGAGLQRGRPRRAGPPGAGHRPPVPLADGAAQHRRPARAGAHRADPRPGRRGRAAAAAWSGVWTARLPCGPSLKLWPASPGITAVSADWPSPGRGREGSCAVSDAAEGGAAGLRRRGIAGVPAADRAVRRPAAPGRRAAAGGRRRGARPGRPRASR